MSYEATTGQNPTPITPGAAQIPPGDVMWDGPKQRKRWPWVVAIVVALFVGGALGASGQSTKTVTATKTVTSIVTNAQTPAACRSALDAADAAFANMSTFSGHVSEAMTASSAAFTAIGNGDAAGTEAAASQMSTVTPKLQADADRIGPLVDRYRAARDECNAS